MSTPVSLERWDVLRRSRGPRAALLIGSGALALIALAGYGAFVIFATGGSLGGGAYLLVAAVAGAGAFFSPCSFPLLPSYFAYAQVVGRSDGRAPGRWSAASFGVASAAGVIAFNLILGAIFAIVGLGVAGSFALLSPSPSGVTLALRLFVGFSLVLLGLVQVMNLSVHGVLLTRLLRRIQRPMRLRDPHVDYFLYGFAYTLVGIGCTAPFLASVIVLALAAGGSLSALGGFLVFALTMAALMILVSLVAAGPRRDLLKSLGARTPAIKRAGGGVLVAFGFLLVVLTVWPQVLAPLFP